ncbi:MAG: cell division ATP-binding protein FtsE [Firmicutes bacterium]|nr:cell division ATP-binding protein FtsE [Bacillota bacterium]
MIRTVHLSKVYGKGARALDDVSLQINRGEFVFVMGKSGAGKSTLFWVLSGQVRPTSGSVFVNDKSIARATSGVIARLRRQMGLVPQDLKLLERRTAYENVAFAMQVIERPECEIKERVREVLAMVGLAGREDAYPNQLSGGEQQRVAIARAIVNGPQIILADEPTGNLDSKTAEDILKILERLNRKGTTVLVATHNESLVESRNHRVVYLERGRVRIDTGGRPLWGDLQ